MIFSHALLIELYKKEKQFQNIYTTFRPSLNCKYYSGHFCNYLVLIDVFYFVVSPITGKFYAHHEENNNQSDPNDYMELLKKAKSLGPKHKYSFAKTENQR